MAHQVMKWKMFFLVLFLLFLSISSNLTVTVLFLFFPIGPQIKQKMGLPLRVVLLFFHCSIPSPEAVSYTLVVGVVAVAVALWPSDVAEA